MRVCNFGYLIIGRDYLHPLHIRKSHLRIHHSLVPELFLSLGLCVSWASNASPCGFQSPPGICRSSPGCLSLALLCRGGAELLFDGIKKHQVTLPGQEEPCEYEHSEPRSEGR